MSTVWIDDETIKKYIAEQEKRKGKKSSYGFGNKSAQHDAFKATGKVGGSLLQEVIA